MAATSDSARIDGEIGQLSRRAEVAIGLQYLAIVVTGIAGIATASMKAVIVGSYVNDFGLSSADAGFALSVSMFAATGGTILSAFVPSRTALFVALMCIVVGDCGTALFGSGSSVFAWQALAGIGHGFALGRMAKAVALVPNPARASGLYGVGYLALSSACTYFLPNIQAVLGDRALFLMIALSGLIALAGISWLPTAPVTAGPAKSVAGKTSARVDYRIAALAALGMLIYYISIGGYWPFMSRVADSWGIIPASRLHILGIAQLLGLCGTLFATVVGDRLGTLRTLTAFLLLQSIAILILVLGSHGELAFSVSACLYVFSWLGGFPYLLSFMSRTDPSGRLNAILIVAANAAYAIGPAGAGLIIRAAVNESAGLAHVVLLGLLFQVSGIVLILLLAGVHRRTTAGVHAHRNAEEVHAP